MSRGTFAFPRNTKPRRYDYECATTFPFVRLSPRPAEPRSGERDRLRLHAHRWAYQYAADWCLRATEALRGTSLLFRGDPGFCVGGGSGLRGRVAALRRPSEKDPTVG